MVNLRDILGEVKVDISTVFVIDLFTPISQLPDEAYGNIRMEGMEVQHSIPFIVDSKRQYTYTPLNRLIYRAPQMRGTYNNDLLPLEEPEWAYNFIKRDKDIYLKTIKTLERYNLIDDTPILYTGVKSDRDLPPKIRHIITNPKRLFSLSKIK